ncbi:MAG: polyprenyl synthetase family protein [Kiritimatiellae bacterium]|nr:polyprenyl synthetase family protein [Kiritimatiellia bacterium]
MFDLREYLERTRAWVEAEMDRRLPRADEWPEGLHAAMRYSLFGGGKRLRPILCVAAAEAVGGRREDAALPAVAIECLHTYTLIHDDLPAMDNDDLRRGRPTSHKVFGEANAILAGDCLLTVAFELLAQSARPGPLALELARAAGSRGVAGGQYEDIAAERAPPDAQRVRRIHLHKTARLIEAACRMGAIAADGDAYLGPLGRYGEAAGLAFQITDDILNATSTAKQLGKAAGSDRERGKLTWVAVHGLERAAADARELVERAVAELQGLPGPVEPLAAIARYVVARDH